ncbi:hypothetical protein HV819_02100 [Anaerococcus sp. AGMB00486]|uniref:DNA-binding protein n=2 Tax=Anaerococcus TaxID=165779 RepID=A0ABX2N7X2_9FIRM|nr:MULTISPECIES: hypothetical protein [Anaerococcus]MSS77407.1 helix-turn-helix domain-containing protein [Anaerococcus porci]NVF10791.1 hypothetical protein [Anaerococcus faecalis]
MEASKLVGAVLEIENENKELIELCRCLYRYSLDCKDGITDDKKSLRNKDFLKQTEVYDYLGIGNETLMKMRIDGLPCYRLSERNIYYSKEDIKRFLFEREE